MGIAITSQSPKYIYSPNWYTIIYETMYTINRSIAIIRPKQPFVEWTNQLPEAASLSLKEAIRDSLILLIMIYDSRKREPASEGDVLGIMSLGCVMEKMWLMAQTLGISFQIMSVSGVNRISAHDVAKGVKRILKIPK